MKTRRILAIATLPTLLSLMTAPIPAYAASVPTQILKFGASGSAVLTLQTMLKNAGYSVGLGKGIFDAKTLDSVKAFQQAQKLIVDGVVGSATWAALQTADAAYSTSGAVKSPITGDSNVLLNSNSRNMPLANFQTDISVDGQHFSAPSGFVSNGTMYIPIWYVMQALSKIGVQNTWNSTAWDMAPPAGVQVNYVNILSGIGANSISINGKVIYSVNGIISIDPESNQPTTFMPIWYVMQVLNRMGLNSSWNGQMWNLPNWSNQGAVTSSSGSGSTGDGSGNSTGSGSAGTGTNSTGTNSTRTNSTGTNSTGTNSTGTNSTGTNSTGTNSTGTNSTGTNSTGSGSGSQSNIPPTPAPPSFTTVDLRFPAPGNINASSIDAFLANHPSPMTGLGQSFIDAQNIYSVDANYLVAQAVLESAWGTSAISQAKNNLFGYGAYDANPGNDAGTFPSEDYAIHFQAWEIRNNYLTSGSTLYVSPTLQGIGVHYATDPQYANSIGTIMNQFAQAEGDSVSSYSQYSPSVMPPSPQGSTEPVYYYNGAQATIIGSPYYNNALPYFPDMLTGENNLFCGTLQNGSVGSNVKSLQNFLNQQINAGLTVDGDFGQMTANAVKTYQTQNNLPVTGVWDFSLWNLISSTNPSVIPSGTTVSIDEAMQGMANGLVTEWDHVVGYGWVDAHYISLTNVYHAVAQSPLSTQTAISVYDPQNPSQVLATIHSGDYVVCTNQTPVNGEYSVQLANQTNGQLITGMIQASLASLVQVPTPTQN